MRFSRISNVLAMAGLLVFTALGVQAQGFYAKAGAGYNVGIGGQNGSKTSISRTQNPQDFSVLVLEEAEWVNMNFGKGLTGSGALGYMFNEQLGAELEVSYLAGGENETYFQSVTQTAAFGTDSMTTSAITEANMLLLQPGLIISTELSDKLDLYGKFGVTFAKGHITSKAIQEGDQDTETDGEYEGGWGFGFQAALGLSCNLSEQYALFSEVRMSNLSYTPTNFHLLRRTDGGDDITDSLPKDTPLEEAYTNTNGQRNVGLKASFPFSHVGLSIGLKYSF